MHMHMHVMHIHVMHMHAEQVMMQDEKLLQLLRALPIGESEQTSRQLLLTCYITQQPCHYASGRVENRTVSGQTSCTRSLLAWREKERLAARGVDIVFKVGCSPRPLLGTSTPNLTHA